MYVIRDAADRVKINIWHGNDTAFYERVEIRFQFRGDKRKVILCMPRNVKIYLGVGTGRHVL